MKNVEDAEILARSLVDTGKALGKNTVAVLTDMNEPLGWSMGNFLEVEESILALKGQGPEDLMEVTLRLTAWMLTAGGICKDIKEGIKLCEEKLSSGEAYNLFMENVVFQGGDPEKLLGMISRSRGRYTHEITAGNSGYLDPLNAYEIGRSGILLGVGRDKTTDPVDPLAGIEFLKKSGDTVAKGEPLCRIYTDRDGALKPALEVLNPLFSVSDNRCPIKKMIIKELSAL